MKYLSPLQTARFICGLAVLVFASVAERTYAQAANGRQAQVVIAAVAGDFIMHIETVDRRGKPLGNTAIRLIDHTAGGYAFFTTNRNGVAAIGITPGNLYSVTASKSGYISTGIRFTIPNSDRKAVVRLSLEPPARHTCPEQAQAQPTTTRVATTTRAATTTRTTATARATPLPQPAPLVGRQQAATTPPSQPHTTTTITTTTITITGSARPSDDMFPSIQPFGSYEIREVTPTKPQREAPPRRARWSAVKR